MEGSQALKKLAWNQYQDSKDKARFISLAQKLSQHLNHLSQDKNVRIRWIWELIQNAKDVPNEFGQCKIRVQIRENSLIFAHNGDPFRVSDLESLVAQYSSKPEENNTNTQTTGKYGTGFITTYILSRKVRIKGLLSLKNKEEKEKVEEEKEEIKEEMKKEVNEGQEDRFQDFQKDYLIEMNKKAVRKFEGGSLYQRFEIFLDREYKNRDQELFFKLMRTQRNLLDDLLKNQPKPKWERKIDELNTQFTYEELDQAALKMITDAMECLKELFPYALLFNSKLAEIQVIDKRECKRIKNFGIKRVEESEYNGIKIFNAQIREHGKDQRIFSIAYNQDEEGLSTLAMPVYVSKEEGKIKLLEVNHKFPKIFKEFPLIGCKDHGFNFIFTSKKFYPNQSRSDLLLKQIQGRDNKKSSTNWWAIQNIFDKGLQMYKKLAQSIAEGQENLLVMTLQNQFTNEDHKDQNIKDKLLAFKEEISKIKFLEFKSGRRGCLKELLFPYGETEKKNAEVLEYSIMLNSCFSKLLGENNTLQDSLYQRMYPYLMAYLHLWQSEIKPKTVDDCVSCFEKITYQNFCYIMGDEESALKYLEKIYGFLKKYNPSLVTQKKKKEGEKYIPFVLTNNKKLKGLNDMVSFKPLMIKDNIEGEYLEIGMQLGIDINQFTIYDKFSKYFDGAKKFSLDCMLTEFRNLFFISPPTKIEAKDIVRLGKFLATFGIESECFQLILGCKNFKNVKLPYKVENPLFKPKMIEPEKKEYRYLFELKVMFYFNDVINRCSKLDQLLPEICYTSQEKKEAIEWLDQLFRLQKKLLNEGKVSKQFINARKFVPAKFGQGGLFGQQEILDKLIDRTLSMSEQFVLMDNIKTFTYIKQNQWFKGNYPDDADIAIYQTMRGVYNRKASYSNNLTLKSLKDEIMHESIEHKLPKGVTFKEKFQFIVPLYFWKEISKDEKLYLLDYIYNLRQAVRKNPDLSFKLNIFSEIQKKAYYDYPSMTECIEKKENQAYAFHIVKNSREMDAAMQISEMYGSLEEALKKLKSLK